MTKYARMDANRIALEVCSADAHATHEPTLAAQFIECPDYVSPGFLLESNGTTWMAPAPIEAPATPLPTISPVMFYMAFTAMEMIAIKASEDPLVKEFFARYMIAYEKNEPIDPNLVSVQEGLAYLAEPASPGPGAGILASTDRIAQISAGIPQ